MCYSFQSMYILYKTQLNCSNKKIFAWQTQVFALIIWRGPPSSFCTWPATGARNPKFSTWQAFPLAQHACMRTKVLKSHFKRELQTKVHMSYLVCNLRLQTKVVVLFFKHTQKICYWKNLTRAKIIWYNFGAAAQTKVFILVSQTKVLICGQNKTPIISGF